MLLSATLCRQRTFIGSRAQRHLGTAARRLLGSSFASQAFDAFLAANPPPNKAPAEDSWIRNEGDHAAGISAGHAHEYKPCGEPRRFHWRQAHTQAAQLARSHHIHWTSELDGYFCMPKQKAWTPALAADWQQGDQVLALRAQQQQQQQESSHEAAEAVTAQQLLLKLPPILRGSVHVPQGRLHEVVSGKAVPGSQLIVLLSADSAALAVCQAGGIVRHKTMTGYTVRRNRNGKAQLTYRRSRPGKNSVGGGIRMREALRLYTSVASRLTGWRADIEACDLLVCSGGIRVWNEVFAAHGDDAVPQRQDARWWRLPLSVPRPRYVDLERAVGVLSYGTITPMTIAP